MPEKEAEIKKTVWAQMTRLLEKKLPPKKKSSKKKKEIAKSHAANEAAIQFFKVNSARGSPNVTSSFPNADN